jgi:hypothetical protein
LPLTLRDLSVQIPTSAKLQLTELALGSPQVTADLIGIGDDRLPTWDGHRVDYVVMTWLLLAGLLSATRAALQSEVGD